MSFTSVKLISAYFILYFSNFGMVGEKNKQKKKKKLNRVGTDSEPFKAVV